MIADFWQWEAGLATRFRSFYPARDEPASKVTVFQRG